MTIYTQRLKARFTKCWCLEHLKTFSVSALKLLKVKLTNDVRLVLCFAGLQKMN